MRVKILSKEECLEMANHRDLPSFVEKDRKCMHYNEIKNLEYFNEILEVRLDYLFDSAYLHSPKYEESIVDFRFLDYTNQETIGAVQYFLTLEELHPNTRNYILKQISKLGNKLY